MVDALFKDTAFQVQHYTSKKEKEINNKQNKTTYLYYRSCKLPNLTQRNFVDGRRSYNERRPKPMPVSSNHFTVCKVTRIAHTTRHSDFWFPAVKFIKALYACTQRTSLHTSQLSWSNYVHCVPKKRTPFYFSNNSVKN